MLFWRLVNHHYPTSKLNYPVPDHSAELALTQHIERLRLRSGDASTLKAIGECRGQQELLRRQSPKILTQLRQPALVESAESPNKR